jgi:hypothetical protein
VASSLKTMNMITLRTPKAASRSPTPCGATPSRFAMTAGPEVCPAACATRIRAPTPFQEALFVPQPQLQERTCFVSVPGERLRQDVLQLLEPRVVHLRKWMYVLRYEHDAESTYKVSSCTVIP